MKELQQIREWIHGNNAESDGLDSSAKHTHGTPLRPVVPLDCRSLLVVREARPGLAWRLSCAHDK